MMKIFLISLSLLISGALGFTISWYVHHSEQQLSEISSLDTPIIQTYHSPISFVKQLKDDPDAGRKIFKEFCTSCHGVNPIIDIHAPRIGDKKVWKGLRQLGIDSLLKLTIKGVKAMPARGGCFECSDQQLRETIEYILQNS